MVPDSRGRQPGRSGFSLVELLVVCTIIAVLVVLLMPGLNQAWRVVEATQCQSNLNRIWQAQCLWRADANKQVFASSFSWRGWLVPYLEGHTEIFACPSAVPVITVSGGDTGGTDDTGGDSAGGDAAGGSSGGGSNTDPNWSEYSFDFDVYWQTPNGSKKRGDFAWRIPLATHPWVRRTEMGAYVHYEVDDEGYTGGANNPPTVEARRYDDIFFNIYYDVEGNPTRIDLLKAQCTGSPEKKYLYDFKVNGEVFIENWQPKVGQSFTFPVAPGGGTGGKSGSSFGSWALDAPSLSQGLVRPTRGDYAVSAGVAVTADGQAVPRVDPRQIFIIDYYPAEPVADYTGGKDDMKGTWNLYFFEDPQAWLQENAASGTDWKPFQALRHFGKANVLFCDGHVEPLGLAPEDDAARTQNRYLYATNPLWQFRGP